MLIDFTVENYRSIKEPVTLSAIAQKSKAAPLSDNSARRIKPDDEIAPPFAVEGWGFELLPVLAIFGANASGKSNVVNALDFLLAYMVAGAGERKRLDTVLMPFLFEQKCLVMPTCFEVRVVLDKAIYTYALHLSSERVFLERLSYALVTTKKDRLLYLRTWDANKEKYVWKNGPAFRGPHQQLESSIHECDPFFSLLIRLNVSEANPLTQWISSRSAGVSLGYEGMDERFATWAAHARPERFQAITHLVRNFDTGISGLEIGAEQRDDANEPGYNLWALHATDRGEVRLPFAVESTGTQRLLGLAGRIFDTLTSNTLLLVDELGSNIHPNIVREIVRMFQSPKTNPKRAQLLFTSHDNTLQRNHLLRRDQIWFTQKRPDGSTDLYPLTDFKPRNDMAIDRAYLDGRYGAVPILPDEDELAITMGKRDAA